MPGATITVRIQDDQVRGFLEALSRRLGDLTPLMRNLGRILEERSMASFAAGVSPEGQAWKPSHRALREGGKTLIDNAILRNSIHVRPDRKSVEVGSPVEYAATHQFGAERGSFGTVEAIVKEHSRKSKKGKEYRVRSHPRTIELPWGDIPARPFLGIATEDWNDIHDAIIEYAVKR